MQILKNAVGANKIDVTVQFFNYSSSYLENTRPFKSRQRVIETSELDKVSPDRHFCNILTSPVFLKTT